jgi:hypothetical protein
VYFPFGVFLEEALDGGPDDIEYVGDVHDEDFRRCTPVLALEGFQEGLQRLVWDTHETQVIQVYQQIPILYLTRKK